jgi:hypothetical protein
MKFFVSRGGWVAKLRQNSVHLAACLFIVVLLAGSLLCASCAHTEAGLQREQVLYVGTSNTLTSLQHTVPYVPAPGNSILEGVLAVGGALMALWATHLHRSLNEVRNGKPAQPAGESTAPAAAGRPPPA